MLEGRVSSLPDVLVADTHLLIVHCTLQGIKFFDPEIVGDTPETVEFKGMQNLLEAVEASLGPDQGVSILKVCFIWETHS